MKKFRLAALLAVPIALYFVLASTISWRPRTLAQYRNPVRSVEFSRDGKYLLCAGGDGSVQIWDVEQKRVVRVLSAKQGTASGAAFSPDGKLIAAAFDGFRNDERGEVRLWDAQSGKLTRTWSDGRGMEGVAFSGDGKTLAGSGWVGVSLWDVASGKEKAGLSSGDDNRIQSVAISHDGQIVIGQSSQAHWWDVRKAGDPNYFGEENVPTGQCSVFSPDGHTLAIGGGGFVCFYDVARRKGTTVKIVVNPSAIAFSADGRTVALGDFDEIVLWDVGKKWPERVLNSHKTKFSSKKINALSFAPDGNTLASGSEDGTLRLWRLR